MTLESRTAVQICGGDCIVPERCLDKIVGFFGINRRTLTLAQAAAPALPDDLARRPYSVLVRAPLLHRLLGDAQSDGWPRALQQAESIFVWDFDDSPASIQVLQALTGADVRVGRAVPNRVTVTAGDESLCGALSGVTADCSSPIPVSVFLGARSAESVRSLLSCADGDVAFTARSHGIPVFVSSAGPALDLDLPVEGSAFDVRKHFIEIVPLTIFLKHAFRSMMPANTVTNAAFIVDDPALKPRYGFLDFNGVLESMERHRFATTIAFIPWNWRRTNPKTARVFLNNPNHYSLVVHGCDHTSHEFGTSSVPALNHKVKVARVRVERHFRQTGVRVSPIMVFPQGVFSPEAAYVLKSNNFIAAVNTEVNPEGHPPTEVGELWRVAIMKYASFPIFTRRYMSHGLENFAFDAFLGKPCLMVAHHEVFKDHARELTFFIDALNGLAGGLRWGSLEGVIKQSFVSRVGDASWQLEMFANEMVLDGKFGGSVRVTKRERDAASIERVTCDGREVDATCAAGVLAFSVEVDEKRASVVRVEYVDRLGDSQSRESLTYKVTVGARRYLSEVRDDYVSRSNFLTACAGTARRLLKTSSKRLKVHG